MVAYIVFTRERTRNQAELDTYSQKVSASMTGRPILLRGTVTLMGNLQAK